MADFGGYRLVFFASIVGMFALFGAAIIIEVAEFSKTGESLHFFAIPLILSALILAMFGAFKEVTVHFKFIEQVNGLRGLSSDAEDHLGLELQSHTNAYWRALVVLIFYGASFLASLIHAVRNEGLSISSTIWIMVAALVCGLAFAVHKIKAWSDLHGYEIAFRLGSTILAGTGLFVVFVVFNAELSQFWNRIVPFEYGGHSAMAFLLASTLWLPLNALYPYDAAIDRLISNGSVDGLEVLLHYASKTFQQVMITLEDDKVYIGYVFDEIPIAGRSDNYLSLLPTLSGYRQSFDKRLQLTTPYYSQLEKLLPSGDHLDLVKSVRISDIRSASIFDPDFVEQFEN